MVYPSAHILEIWMQKLGILSDSARHLMLLTRFMVMGFGNMSALMSAMLKMVGKQISMQVNIEPGCLFTQTNLPVV
jgi:hypothetical protein